MLRDLSPEVTNHLLKKQFLGCIGCAADGQVLVLPVTYLYDGHAIYGQIREGTKTRLLRKNPAVCFEVDEQSSPTCWQSVVVQGMYEDQQVDTYSIHDDVEPGINSYVDTHPVDLLVMLLHHKGFSDLLLDTEKPARRPITRAFRC
ncbi:MAG: hypothetical protein JWP57_1654 [Spirosoma sp.]|nr:hypothetical protein [Spirosoma sp.]